MAPYSITVSGDSLSELSERLTATAKRLAADAQDEPAAAAAAPAAPRAAPRKRATPEASTAPVAAPVAAPAAPAPVAAPADGDALKKVAIAALVKLINANDALGKDGKRVCTDLCLKFGGANVSKIDPAKYPALIKEVEEALEALSSDPTA